MNFSLCHCKTICVDHSDPYSLSHLMMWNNTVLYFVWKIVWIQSSEYPVQIDWYLVNTVWLACLPVTQKIGARFYLERESSATSGWINIGHEWCCWGWSIEGGTPCGLFRTRDGLQRIRKARAARNVHECESVCAWNKNSVSAPKWLPCMNACYVCCISLYMYLCMCSN